MGNKKISYMPKYNGYRVTIIYAPAMKLLSPNPNLYNKTSHKTENREALKGFSVSDSKGANQI